MQEAELYMYGINKMKPHKYTMVVTNNLKTMRKTSISKAGKVNANVFALYLRTQNSSRLQDKGKTSHLEEDNTANECLIDEGGLNKTRLKISFVHL